MPDAPDRKTVLAALRDLLYRGAVGTQDEIVAELKKLGVRATQSSVSRALARLRAVREKDAKGRSIYHLPREAASTLLDTSVAELVRAVEPSVALVVVHTTPGSAGHVAYHLDRTRPGGILGTIAGDDTIFVAPAAKLSVAQTVRAVKEALGLGRRR